VIVTIIKTNQNHYKSLHFWADCSITV